MKKLLTVLVLIGLVATVAMAGWTFEETIFDFTRADTMLTQGTKTVSGEDYHTGVDPHGVVVDPNGNYWVATYGTVGDDFITASGDTAFYRPLRCYAPDGTIVHEITSFQLPNGDLDTLWSGSDHSGTGRGIAIDNDGNILYSSFATLYRFNYESAECTGKFYPAAGSLTDAFQTSNGTIYVGHVGANKPIYMLDEDLGIIGNAIDTVKHLSRSLVVKESPEGGFDLYSGTIWTGYGVEKYHSDDPDFDLFVSVDTLMQWSYTDESGLTAVEAPWSSSLDLAPNGDLLVGCLRITWGGHYGSQWYVINTETLGYEAFGVAAPDSATANKDIYIAGGVNGPRGGYFLDDETLITCDFYLGTVDKWVYSETSVEEEAIVSTFKLEQNYPNPFNPTTTIAFTIAENAPVTLTVYNMLGAKVATLMNSEMRNAGTHNINFDASGLSTGMYFYRLESAGNVATQKMLFLK